VLEDVRLVPSLESECQSRYSQEHQQSPRDFAARQKQRGPDLCLDDLARNQSYGITDREESVEIDELVAVQTEVFTHARDISLGRCRLVQFFDQLWQNQYLQCVNSNWKSLRQRQTSKEAT
jgi:hypothetical protein